MHRRALLMSAASAALVACSNAPREGAALGPTVTAPSLAAPQEAQTDVFDVALYRAIAAQPGNQFISPYSVSTAFALVYPGAGGTTGAEIAETFGFDVSPQAQAQQARATAEAITRATGGSEFSAANAAWIERSIALRPEYARTIRDELVGTIEPVDFKRNQAAALRQINAWAARETRGRIPEILTSQDPLRRLVLTNAVYFKGKWSDPFSSDNTQDGDFYTGTNTRVRARLMRQTTSARYFETPTFQAADFDYDDGAFALAVFLPRQRTGLATFESGLTGETLNAYMDQLGGAQRRRLDLTLPKVEMRTEYILNAQLQSLGVRIAFSEDADFSAITADEGLKISSVIHKAFLAVDEEGTEAAAVTAIDIVTTAAPIGPPPPPPIEFKAERPFFVVLHHKPTRARLFLGRIATIG